MLQEKTPAPDFTLNDKDGNKNSLSDSAEKRSFCISTLRTTLPAAHGRRVPSRRRTTISAARIFRLSV